MLARRGETVAVAESCTGGMLAERITQVPGSSAYFIGGFVSYATAAKQRCSVSPKARIRYRKRLRELWPKARGNGWAATWGISVTGEAGPESATDVPVGTVFIGIAGPDGTE